MRPPSSQPTASCPVRFPPVKCLVVVMGQGRRTPHAWQSVPNAEICVGNIRDAMVAADPANATTYRANAAVYLTKLEALDHDVREAVAWIPPDRRKVI